MSLGRLGLDIMLSVCLIIRGSTGVSLLRLSSGLTYTLGIYRGLFHVIFFFVSCVDLLMGKETVMRMKCFEPLQKQRARV